MRVSSVGLPWNLLGALEAVCKTTAYNDLSSIAPPSDAFDMGESTDAYIFKVPEIKLPPDDCQDDPIEIPKPQDLQQPLHTQRESLPFYQAKNLLSAPQSPLAPTLQSGSHAAGSEVDRFMSIRKRGDLSTLSAENIVPETLNMTYSSPIPAIRQCTEADETCPQIFPTTERRLICSPIFMMQTELLDALRLLKVTTLERDFPTNCVFLNASTCVILIQIDMILDPEIIATLAWHAIKVRKMHLLFKINGRNEGLKPYTFTPPIQKALFEITTVSNSFESLGTRVQKVFVQSTDEIAYWIRHFADEARFDQLPDSPPLTSILATYPMINPYLDEIMTAIAGPSIYAMSLKTLIHTFSTWIEKDRLVSKNLILGVAAYNVAHQCMLGLVSKNTIPRLESFYSPSNCILHNSKKISRRLWTRDLKVT